MKKRSRMDGRVLIGSGYLAGELDARDAGPIPAWAGIKFVADDHHNEAPRETPPSPRSG